ncbi:MAG: hypothetical protein ACRC4M_05955 [Mycoplasma sp.]
MEVEKITNEEVQEEIKKITNTSKKETETQKLKNQLKKLELDFNSLKKENKILREENKKFFSSKKEENKILEIEIKKVKQKYMEEKIIDKELIEKLKSSLNNLEIKKDELITSNQELKTNNKNMLINNKQLEIVNKYFLENHNKKMKLIHKISFLKEMLKFEKNNFKEKENDFDRYNFFGEGGTVILFDNITSIEIGKILKIKNDIQQICLMVQNQVNEKILFIEKSQSGSYYFENEDKTKLFRLSNHWGNINRNIWKVNNDRGSEYYTLGQSNYCDISERTQTIKELNKRIEETNFELFKKKRKKIKF